MNLTAHLFYDHFADRKAETTTWGIGLAVLFKVIKVDKKTFELLLWNAAAEILNAEFELDVASVFFVLIFLF